MLPQFHEIMADRVIPDLARNLRSAAAEAAGEGADVFAVDSEMQDMIHALFEFLGLCDYEVAYGDTPILHPCQLTPEYARAFWADQEAQS